MKKLIVLFITAIAFSSCSNDDDNTNKVTALEGNWLLVYLTNGTPLPETDPSDIVEQNIQYHFKSNKYNITINTKIIERGTFSINEYHTVSFNRDSQEHSENYSIYFSEENMVVFSGSDTDRQFILKKIQ